MRNGKSIGRTIVAVLGLIAVAPAIAGCEGADAGIPPTRHNAVGQTSIAFAPSHVAFANLVQAARDPEAASTPVDLATILTSARVVTRSAERTAAELPALRRAITLCALALLGIGVLNAALLGAILHALRKLLRATAAIGSEGLPPAAPATAPAALATTASTATKATTTARTVRGNVPPTCGCGNPISVRSSSGRCRECAGRRRSAAVLA